MEISEAELQVKIDAAIKTATDGLILKRDELLGKIDKHKQDLLDVEKIKTDALETERQEKLTAEGKHEEVLSSVRSQMQATIDDLQTRLETSITDGTKATKDLRVLMVDRGLSAAFLGAGVTNEDYLEAVVTLNAPNAEIVDDEDGKPVVKIAGLPMDEFITSWATGKGKAFISDGRTGTGAGSDTGGGTDDAEVYFRPGTVNQSKQLALKSSDPVRYEALDKQYNQNKPLPLSAQR